MHVGHGRGAVVGDALAALLAKAGFAVHREYYINDAGAQVDVLARSALSALPRGARRRRSAPIPEGFYPGEYLIETGRALAERDGDKWLGRPEAEWLAPVRDFAVAEMMALIRADLAALGVDFDAFTSERELVESGAVDAALAALTERGLIYDGRARAAQGQAARRLGAAAADPVPRHAIRRRGRPAAEEIRRLVDLFRRRHRLSPRQVAAAASPT